MKFTGNITFKSGSAVNVVGEYALSIRSLHGSIDIQTDINMTCGEKVYNITCLGGFTQSAAGKLSGPEGRKTLVHQGKNSVLIFSLFQVYYFYM